MGKTVWAVPCFFYAVVLFFYTFHLGQPHLWNDEAASAIYSRNILQTGTFSAFDGRNLENTLGCTHLPTDTHERIVQSQYYIGSFFTFLLGESTFALRLGFAFIATLSFWMLFIFLRPHFENIYASILSCTILLLPQTILFARQARHYGIDIFIYTLLICLVFNFKTKPFLKHIFLFILFCISSYIHPFVSFGISLGYFSYTLFLKKDILYSFFSLMGCFIPLFTDFFLHKKMTVTNDFFLSLFQKDPSDYVFLLFQFIYNAIKNLDYINATPLLSFFIIVVYVLISREKNEGSFPLLDKVVFLGLSIFIPVIFIASTIGAETRFYYGIVRYYPYIQISSSLFFIFLLQSFFKQKTTHYICFISVYVFHIGSLSYWDLHNNHPSTWVTGVYREIFFPKPGPWQKTLDYLSTVTHDKNDLLLVEPHYARDIFMYYLGHSFIVTPKASHEKECSQEVHHLVGENMFQKYHEKPQWVVSFGNPLPNTHTVQTLKTGYALPDATRPELTRHDFYGEHSSFVYIQKPEEKESPMALKK